MTLRSCLPLASAFVVGALACSSASPSAHPATAPPFVSGTYRAVTPGTIGEITFYATDHYLLVRGGCANALLGTAADSAPGAAPPSLSACNELGTYSFDSAGTTLILSPPDAPSRSLAFVSIVADTSFDSTESLSPSDGLRLQGGVPLGGSDASLAPRGDASSLAGEAGVALGCPGRTVGKSGVPLSHAFSAGGQQVVGGSAPSGTPDPTQGGQWSCTGSYDGTASNAYYLTSFGCSGSNPSFQDSGDNCCGAGAPVAASQGLCGTLQPASTCSNSCANNSSCNTWRTQQSGGTAASFQCEEMVNYYSTDAVAYGIGSRLCLSTPGGKGVVVFVYDDGPSCTIEQRVSAHVLDVSPPTAQYLFGEGGQLSATERNAVFVTRVGAGTALGPNDSCATAPPDAGAGAPDSGGSSGSPGGSDASSPGGSSGSDAGGTDAGCPATCSSDSDCNPQGPLGLACVNGTCQGGCHGAAQCAGGTTCSNGSASMLGACQGTTGGQSCTNDGACNPGGNGAGLICSSGACTAGCRASWQCPGNTSCSGGQCH